MPGDLLGLRPRVRGRPAYAGVIARARVAGGADHSASRGRLWTPRFSPRRRVWASGGGVPLDVRHPAPGTRQPAPRPWDHLGGLRGVPGRHRADQVAVVVPRNRPDVTRAETLRELGPRARRHRLLFAGGDAPYPLRRRRPCGGDPPGGPETGRDASPPVRPADQHRRALHLWGVAACVHRGSLPAWGSAGQTTPQRDGRLASSVGKDFFSCELLGDEPLWGMSP